MLRSRVLISMMLSLSVYSTFAASSWTQSGDAITSSAKLGATSNQPLNIITNNTQRMTVTADGKVGINVTTPSSLLDVRKSANTTTGNAVNVEGADSGIYVKSTSANSTGIIAAGNGATPATYTNGSGGAFTGKVVGVYGRATNTTGDRFGGFFYTSGSANAYVAANISGTNYKIIGSGSVSTIVDTPDHKKAIMYAPESPEIQFTDNGVGKLAGGRAHIDLDPVLSHNIIHTAENPIKVFIQLEEDCEGVFVTNKTKTGFDVIELKGGDSNASFSWQVIANRKNSVNKDGTINSQNEGKRFPVFEESAALKE